MLLYYPFWMFMGSILHIYIIFGTNLLTGGPSRIAVFFCLFQCFEEKEYQTESKRNETFGSVIFWNERDPEDLECKSRSSRGSHEIGGCPPIGRAPCLVGPSGGHRRTSSSYIYLHTPKTSRGTTKHNFHHRNLLYPRDPILEPSPALRRRGNRPWRASTLTP